MTFDDTLDEVHGFRPLFDCDSKDYKGAVPAGGLTALYDATYNAVGSVSAYGRQLSANDFDVNACVFVITDGMDNKSTATRQMVKEAFREAVRDEDLESMVSVLVGVNAGGDLNDYLKAFKNEAGFDEYIAIEKASKESLAGLSGFVSRSIRAQSMVLGSGRSIAF